LTKAIFGIKPEDGAKLCQNIGKEFLWLVAQHLAMVLVSQ